MITGTKNKTDVAEFISLLHGDSGEYFEIRVVGCPQWEGSNSLVLQSGFFKDPKRAAKAIAEIEKLKPEGIYVLLNPVSSETAAKCFDRMKKAETDGTTSDAVILRRRWFIIDIDPLRTTKTSSTNAEMQFSLAKAELIEKDLTQAGWPEPIRTMSGNGSSLLYRIDLPNNEAAKSLLERCLVAVNNKYSDEQVNIDTTMFNASRVSKACGTVARKGSDFHPDDEPEDRHRRHRRSWFISPERPIGIVTDLELEELAASYTPPKEPELRPKHQNEFSLDRWIQEHNVPVGNPVPYRGGRKWIFESLPIPCESSPSGHGCDGSGAIFEAPDGKIGAVCQHDRCQWKWKDLREAYEPGCYAKNENYGSRIVEEAERVYRERQEQHGHHEEPKQTNDQESTTSTLIKPVSISDLIYSNPDMRPVVVEGILRRGETANIIAAAKIGKSHLAGGLAWSIVTGIPWLSHDVAKGKVLVIDNELHPETLANRLERIAMTMMIDFRQYAESLDVISLRGKDISIHAIEHRLASIQPGTYSLAIVDALYRTLPSGTSENDNAAMMAIYNKLDHYASEWDCAIAVVHHASKGAQGDKAVTDVGAGAGSISRAADTHIVIRPHEDPKLSVLECVTRSFKSPEPVSIRFDWPLWTAVTTKPNVKKATQPRQAKQAEDDKTAKDEILAILNKYGKPFQQQRLIEESGFSVNRVTRILALMAGKDKTIKRLTKTKQGTKKPTVFWKVLPAVLPPKLTEE